MRKVPEGLTYLYAGLLAGILYAATFNYHGVQDVQGAILDAVVWVLGTGGPAVLGGTFTASSAAKAGLAVVPLTNSK